MKNKLIFITLICGIAFMGCEENVLPKPKAMLRLQYPKISLKKFEADNFQFEYNALAALKIKNKKSLTLEYPEMKGAIFISYKEIDQNLEKLVSDAQKLSYEHAAKADGIRPRVFANAKDKVYGMFMEVRGDAASQAQFYVTDSTKHFLTGSLYFYTKPNYDSIYPAAIYLQEDIGRIMETLKWKE